MIRLGRIDRQFPLPPVYLTEDLTWESEDNAIAKLIAVRFDLDDYASPADGQPGRKLLQAAAEFLEGTPVWLAGEPAPAPPGRVY
jgi:hypothetical protein